MRETQTPDLLTLPNCLLAVFSSQHLALDQAWLQNKGCANVGDKRLLSARLTFSRLGVFVRRYSKVKFMLNHCFMLVSWLICGSRMKVENKILPSLACYLINIIWTSLLETQQTWS